VGAFFANSYIAAFAAGLQHDSESRFPVEAALAGVNSKRVGGGGGAPASKPAQLSSRRSPSL